MKNAPVASKQLYQSNMAQQPSCYPYRDKIVATGQQIIQDSHCITSSVTPDTSTCFYDSTVNYTSPYSSSAYIDSNCIQSSPVAEVPSVSSYSFDNISNSFEPIYYTDLSTCPEYNNTNNSTSSEKSVNDWIQYLHSDEEGTSFDESLGVNNCDTLFPEFGEDDLSMLDTILAEETFLEEFEPSQPQQDMPAGSSASPQYQYLPEQQQQQPSVSHYIPIAPKPIDYQPSQQPSPTSSTSSTTTKSSSRKRQRIDFQNPEEEYRIKRNLNNIASARSRQKKREQQEFMKQEKVRLESRNRQLKNEVEEYERQIATLKEILYSKIKK